MQAGKLFIRVAIPAMVLACSSEGANFGPFSCSTCGGGFDASAFNVVTLGVIGGANANAGNFNPSSDIGGGVAVFGNYTGNGYAINTQVSTVPNPYTDTYSMVVNGSISTNPFTVGNGSTSPAQTVWIGGSYTPFNSPAPTVVKTAAANDFDFYAARTSLQSLSTNTLVNYATAVTVTPQSNGTNYFVSPSAAGLTVYNVDYSYFTNQNLGFEVDLNSGQSVVVNVTGSPASLTLSKGASVRYNGNMVNANTTGGVPVLFNLPSTTTLSTGNGSINGSVLAPYATLNSQNQTVDGQLFVAAVNGLAETHDQYYSGSLPSLALTSTPEPATFFMVGGALIAIGMLRRKCPRKTAAKLGA